MGKAYKPYPLYPFTFKLLYMKIWLHKLILLALCAVVLSSCEKDEDQAVLRVQAVPTLTVSSTDLVLTEETAGEEAVILNWTPADFGYHAAVNYVLEVDKVGNDFATPAEEELGYAASKTFTVGELNTIVNRVKEITGFSENEMEVRLRADVSDFVSPVYSNTVPVTITPYLQEPPYPTIYMVGDATESGWDNANPVPMFRSGVDPFLFTYTGQFKAGSLKFLAQPGLWAPQWGKTEDGILGFRETEDDAEPGALDEIQAEGLYNVSVSLRDNTYTVTPYEPAAGAKVYPSVGIIGIFNDWTDIEPMMSSTLNPHVWRLEYTFPADTELKFRHAPDWDVNWGGTSGKEGEVFGMAVAGGPNLKVAAGTYTILFNDLTEEYSFIPKE